MLLEIKLMLHLIIFQFRLLFVYWLAGIFIGAVVSTFLGSRVGSIAEKIGNRKFGIIAVFVAALLGVVSPLCMYGTIPIIAALGRKGMPEYIIASFMVSSILINPNLFVFSLTLGLPIALMRLSACILAGVTAGALVSIFFKNKKLFNFEGFEEKKRHRKKQGWIRKILDELNRSIIKTFPYLLAGIILTALSDRFIPSSFLVSLFGRNNGWGIILASSISVPLYLCGGGTIPIIKAWLSAGMSPGSALAFMIAGPATKLTNLSAVKTILGVKNFTVYIAFNILFSITAGYIVNLFCKLI